MIFLGAGASVQFRIPTTNIFTEEIEKILYESNPDFLRDFKEYHYKQFEEYPNFEHLLTLLRSSTYPNEIEKSHYTKSFFATYENYAQNYQKIIEDMYDLVYKFCCDPFEKDSSSYLHPIELEKKFQMSYDALIGLLYELNKVNFNVVTTNYDPSIELWCQKRNLTCLDGTQDTNNFDVRQRLPPNQHILQINNSNVKENELGLVRLHGSVWSGKTSSGRLVKFTRPKSHLYFYDLYEEIFGNRPDLIFPGEEANINRSNWYNYLHFFRQQLQGNCLFIGYSFSHPVIRDIVKEAVTTGNIVKLGLFSPNPQKILDTIFPEGKYPQGKIVLLTGHFGEEDGLTAIAKWVSVYGIRYSGGSSVKGVSKKWRDRRESQYIREARKI